MAEETLSSKERFSTRVGNYIRYRPSYPPEVIDAIVAECGLSSASVVADVGSGTGILTRPLLGAGCDVFAVEPNREMREAGERLLGGNPRFHSVEGSAEHTTLGDRSVDLVAAGQSFHWFDRPAARIEFVRILKPRGWVALVWNARDTKSTLFLAEYDRFLHEYGTDYAKVNHENLTEETFAEFFAPRGYRRLDFRNRQDFDFDGLRGRTLSSSFMPEAGHPRHLEMVRALEAMFRAHERQGKVAFEYQTRLYLGQL